MLISRRKIFIIYEMKSSLFPGVIVRKLPFRFIFNMGNALFTAFGTASSSATLPVTIEVLEERNGIDPRITRLGL